VGRAAALEGFHPVVLGTVGAAMFLLTVGLGVTLLIVSMEVNIRRARGADSDEEADLE
jgi:hypothetical protein